MGLLKNRDPYYWLSKLVEMDPPVDNRYAFQDFKNIVVATATLGQSGIAAASDANTFTTVLLHKDEWDTAVYPMLDRISAFNNKYTALLQTGGTPDPEFVEAPDLKPDAVEVTTWVAATLAKLQLLLDNQTWYEKIFGTFTDALANWASLVYKAVAGIIAAALAGLGTGIKILLWGAALGGGAYGAYRAVEWSKQQKTKRLRR